MPHLDNLGLKENPFINNDDYRYYYADQNRAQILESTEHLIEFSSNLQVIIGAQGMGKSHLLNTLAHRLDNNWRIARIQLNEQVDTLSLIHEILEAFGGQIKEGEELLEALENQLSDILQLGFKPVLFLDDAHYLSIDSIRFLLQLSQQQQDDEPYIKIVLFASVEITENLQSSELRVFRDSIHISHLEALDKEGVAGYLRHKLAIVGFDRESPFTPRIIDSIYKNSQGIPEKVDFYANKFLVSSGKAEDYIIQDETLAASTVEMPSESSWSGADLQDDRIDKAEQQLNRLTEQFDEIEKMTEPTLPDEKQEEEYRANINEALNSDETEFPEQDNDTERRSVISRLLIPAAVVAVVLLAIILMKTVFNSLDTDQSRQHVKHEEIELLPLELPVQKNPLGEQKLSEKNPSPVQSSIQSPVQISANLNNSTDPQSAPKVAIPIQEQQSETIKPVKNLPEISESVDTSVPLIIEKAKKQETEANHIAPSIRESDTENQTPAIEKKLSMLVAEPAVPELAAVEPKPVIGSNKRKIITIIGNKLQPDSRLIVTSGTSNKIFSASQTPEQWQYINSNKVKLTLATGIESRVWQVVAENSEGQRSNVLTFDVVKPFIAKMSISAIFPEPVVGSNKRQYITIKGQGFTPQTVIELKWDKNNKHFSSSLSPEQFKYLSTNEIHLHITTGTKERKWKVIAKDPQSGATGSSFFEVKKQTKAEKKAETKVPTSIPLSSRLKDKSWINQQEDNNYTIQLFSSYQLQAIERFIQKYALQGDLAYFVSKRDGKKWFSLIYGAYATKQAASNAVSALNTDLSKTKPWIRTFGSLKDQLSDNKKTISGTKPQITNFQATDSKTIGSKVSKAVPAGVSVSKPKTRNKTGNKTRNKTRDEAWIWTQSPADYTLQLVALSNESSIKAYINKYKLGSQAVYFKFIKNGKPLYVLVYGSYPDKAAASWAVQTMAAKMSATKPWIRRFSDIHNMMTVQ